jgi:hypothetical protein
VVRPYARNANAGRPAMTPPVKLERCPVTDARSAMLDRLRDEGDEYASAFNNGVRAAIAMHDSYTAMHQASRIAEGIVSEGELLSWLGENVNLELQWSEVDGDLSECAWHVFRRSGGLNDREWSEIARGDTPTEALSNARAAFHTLSVGGGRE